MRSQRRRRFPLRSLKAAGLWERREGGYFVVADDVLKIAIDYNEGTARKEAECAEPRAARLA